jgi:aminopeptidase
MVKVTVSAPLTHDARLDRLAELAVKVGLGLQKGQELVMTASPLL